ncbi:fimbrial protein StaF [Escherichia coli]|uniref:fimbrial-like protein n=2 Tax=Escherichia coli TaxID=562 RepID=UPI0016A615ED|nr:fimbrial-like protein [Escherichia coli]EFJ7399972.1 fimbrial protein StaF [Escherichia coli]EHL6043924.1 fimbrial protein StaF [Escherichia coli]EJH5924461.1 fimbrial protein StaF [Escherichia coli]EJH6907534.1 fimbrial protein StaF [Escherichia coli]ELH6822558.1 fimbrial protein StaF [Escherichia coli]
MLSSQLKIKIKTSLFLALLFATSSPVYAGLDVDMVANIKNSTCKSGLSNLGNIDLGVVGVEYFSGNVTAEDNYPGGREFTVTVTDCAIQGSGNVLNQLHINFKPLNGVMATGSQQIFANENVAGAQNVGVVIFSIQDPANTFNVLNPAGSSRSIYPVMTTDLNNSSWKFYTRMQKINPALNIASGQVKSTVLIDIYYE